jgi:hypothetical protein
MQDSLLYTGWQHLQAHQLHKLCGHIDLIAGYLKTPYQLNTLSNAIG